MDYNNGDTINKNESVSVFFSHLIESISLSESNKKLLDECILKYLPEVTLEDSDIFKKIENIEKEGLTKILTSINQNLQKDTLDALDKYLSLVIILRIVFKEYDDKKTKLLTKLLETLKEDCGMTESKFSAGKIEFVLFIKHFFEASTSNPSPMQTFHYLFGPSTDYLLFNRVASKFYKIIFFRHRVSKISFYEYSLVTRFEKLHCKGLRYIRSIVLKSARCFIKDVLATFRSKRRYKLSPRFVKIMAMKIDPLVNSFNGIINELNVNIINIPKIVYIILVFHIENKESIFLKNFGIQELFYCAVRTFNQSEYFAKKLENFIKTKLFWVFSSEKDELSPRNIYEHIYKNEYIKIIGGIMNNKPVLFKYSFSDTESSSSTVGRENTCLKTNVVNRTPKMNKEKSVKVFSPLSQRIADARGTRETPDSKRKLNFE